MSVDKLKKGGQAIITKIAEKNSAYVEELAALGLTEGVQIKCVRKSIGGNLIHLQCNNNTVVVRKKEANIIEIRSIK